MKKNPPSNGLPEYRARESASHVIPAILLCGVFVFMLAWTWFKWPDPLVDFGRELYVPWQLSEGRILYRDIAYFNGPLSPHVNSLVMRVLGVSLRSIVIANLAILALLVVMMYRLALLVGDWLGATLACLLLITVFAFLQLAPIGNYNFVTPYSHELTHGIALSFAAMLCLARFVSTGRTIWASGVGLLLGLIFLTKPEVFVAAGVALAFGMIVSLWSRRASRRHATQVLAQFAASALVAPVVALMLLMIRLGPRDALRGVIGGWLYLFDPRLNQMKFYQRVFGSTDIATSLHGVITSAVWLTALAGVVAAVALALRGPQFRRTPVTLVALVLAGAAMYAIYQVGDLNWQLAFRGLGIVLVVIEIALIVWIIRQSRADDGIEPRAMLRFTLTTFAIALLAKVFLNILLYHYGFALVMPAAFVTVLAMASWGPHIIDGIGGSGNVARGAAIAMVGLVIFVHLRVYQLFFSSHPLSLGTGPDRFHASDAPPPRANSVRLMIDRLATLPPGATVATVPEGAMINYLARRVNPTGHINLMPVEVVMFGQDRIVHAFAEHPPDYIVFVVASDPSDYGVRSFWQDYGRDVVEWIAKNYADVPAPTDAGYPLRLVRRK